MINSPYTRFDNSSLRKGGVYSVRVVAVLILVAKELAVLKRMSNVSIETIGLTVELQKGGVYAS